MAVSYRKSIRGFYRRVLLAPLVAAAALCAVQLPAAAQQSIGTWTPMSTAEPTTFSSFLLLTDGTVMCEAGYPSGGNTWYKLTPDIHGSYATGTFTQLASMNDTRLYYATQVMQNGSVFVAGGEYGTGANKSEIYNPLTNAWTEGPNSEITMGITDSISILLNTGSVMIGSQNQDCQIYNPTSNSFGTQFSALQGLDEADWCKLPDDSVLCIDDGSWSGTYTSERYIPSQGKWVDDALLPVDMYSSSLGEIGQENLLPNGKVFCTGGPAVTAIYTPSGNANPGSWVEGPVIPGGLGESDAPSANLVDGNVLFDAGPANTYNAPTSFFIYNYQQNTITQIEGPTGATDNIQPFVTTMLDLPNGTVLYQGSNNIYFYTPSDSAITAGQPVIQNISQNSDGSFLLTGTGLNGLNQGALYGDDKQMDSNYPLVRLTSTTTGNIYYARTYNWSSTSVQTGSRALTTDFTLPAGIPNGSYSLVTAANGNASPAVVFNIPFSGPAAPTNLAASAGNAKVSLTWTASTGATSYNVYRGTTSGGESPTPIATGITTTSYADTTVTNGVTYFYTVEAVDAAGVSGPSNEASATPNVPGAYNVYAINTEGTSTIDGGIDTVGFALDSSLLGATASWNTHNFTLGPANAPDAWSSTTVPISGTGNVYMLADGVEGAQSNQTFTVTYTDGTTSTFTQSLSDWCNSQAFAGESIAVSMASRLGSTGAVVGPGPDVYGYVFPLTPGETAKSITLPSNRFVVALAFSVGVTTPGAPTGLTAASSDTPGHHASASR